MWCGRNSEKKFHLLDWASVCEPKREGGLGIRPSRLINQALLGKGLWRFGDASEGLWRRLLMAKYGASRDGCDVVGAAYKLSAIWRGILSAKDKWRSSWQTSDIKWVQEIRYSFGMILGWPLADQFQDIFRCATDKEAKVSCYMEKFNSMVVWVPILRRNLTVNEESEVLSLPNILSEAHLLDVREGTRFWATSKVEVLSPLSSQQRRSASRSCVASIWKLKSPLRVVMFGWFVVRGLRP